jgi:hypothetical protein
MINPDHFAAYTAHSTSDPLEHPIPGSVQNPIISDSLQSAKESFVDIIPSAALQAYAPTSDHTISLTPLQTHSLLTTTTSALSESRAPTLVQNVTLTSV